MAEQHIEARIVIPSRRNDDSTIKTDEEYAIRGEEIEHTILAAFGGFTLVTGYGAWVEDTGEIEEPVHVYTVAMALNGLNTIALFRIRDIIRERLDQRAVYISRTRLMEEPL